MVQRYTAHDVALCSSFMLSLNGGLGPIEFQFPPSLPSDNRRGTWAEGELRGTEPIAVFATSGPRTIALSWTYIVDGNLWTAARIQNNIRRVRGYYAQVRDPGSTRKNLAVQFKPWAMGGKESMSARIVSIDVKHGKTIVGPPESAFHLRTDIGIDLRLWTSLDSSKFIEDDADLTKEFNNKVAQNSNKYMQDIPGLKQLTPDWY